MIIVIAGVKGGIGKSTIASNVAVLAARAGRGTMLIDADSSDQQTTMRWAAVRNDSRHASATLTTLALHGKSIRPELLRLRDRYDVVVVDPAARDSDTQRAALSVADLAVLPFPPRGPDLWTIDAVVDMLGDIRLINPHLRALAFVNRADSAGIDNEEAELAFAEHAESIESLPIRVGNRKAIANAHLMGLAAAEMPRSDHRAVAELSRLYSWLMDGAQKAPKTGTASIPEGA